MQRTLKLALLLCLSLVTGCSNKEKTIVVGASSTPHAMILEQAKEYVESKGYALDVRVFNDYVLPNYALENEELDANYFQHEPYLNTFNESNGTHLVSVFKVHFEPMGIYQGNKSTLESYTYNDKIVVPSDLSNYNRAMDLLKECGMDTCTNIVAAEAQMIPLMLQDCDYAVINGNYALSSGVLEKSLYTENKDSHIANLMANIIAVKSGQEQSEKTKVLIEALSQDNIKEYIISTFGSSVIPMF